MSEPELATKTPESDLAMDTPTTTTTQTQPSLISSSDTPAQTGPTMGEHCTTDRPLPANSSRPSGELTTLSNGSMEAYVSKPADYPQTPGKLLLLLSGGTGIKSINNQLQADLWAAKGFVVVMPDQFDGDVVPGPSTAAIASPTADSAEGGGIGGLIEQVKLKAAEAAKSFVLDMWLARQGSEKVLPRLRRAVEGVRDEYADSIASGGGIYAAGYCFGAKYVLVLAGENAQAELARTDEANAGKGKDGDEEATVGGTGPDASGSVIKAGTIAHGTLVTRDDLLKIAAPVSMVCVEDDPLFPEEILEVGRKHLGTTKIDHEIKTYSGVPHGFAVVGEYQDAKIAEEQVKAFDQMVNWLQMH